MSSLGYHTPVKMLPYRNGELCICHLDGYRSDTSALLDRVAEIETALNRRPVNVLFHLWFNLDDNDLDPPTMKRIAESVARIRPHIYKIAFIGLCGMERQRFDRALRKALGEAGVARAYFLDAEQAKDWLL